MPVSDFIGKYFFFNDTYFTVLRKNIGTGGFGRRASDGGAYLQMYCIEDGDESEGQIARNPHSVSINFKLTCEKCLGAC